MFEFECRCSKLSCLFWQTLQLLALQSLVEWFDLRQLLHSLCDFAKLILSWMDKLRKFVHLNNELFSRHITQADVFSSSVNAANLV